MASTLRGKLFTMAQSDVAAPVTNLESSVASTNIFVNTVGYNAPPIAAQDKGVDADQELSTPIRYENSDPEPPTATKMVPILPTKSPRQLDPSTDRTARTQVRPGVQ